jgi:hypothetical protein
MDIIWSNSNRFDRYTLCMHSLGLYNDLNKWFWTSLDWNNLPKRVQTALLGPQT